MHGRGGVGEGFEAQVERSYRSCKIRGSHNTLDLVKRISHMQQVRGQGRGMGTGREWG